MRASPNRPSPRKIFPFNNNESEEKKLKTSLPLLFYVHISRDQKDRTADLPPGINKWCQVIDHCQSSVIAELGLSLAMVVVMTRILMIACFARRKLNIMNTIVIIGMMQHRGVPFMLPFQWILYMENRYSLTSSLMNAFLFKAFVT